MKTGSVACGVRTVGGGAHDSPFRPRTFKTRERHEERAEAMYAATIRGNKPARRLSRRRHVVARSNIRSLLDAAYQESAATAARKAVRS